MLIRKAYYLCKPLIPWTVRTALRRQWAARRRPAFASIWPIDPSSGAAPSNWAGWPDGKRFGVVLTHDVEGTKGLHRVEPLMEVETRLGFRSSFNFVPEGQYRVPASLRTRMEAAGFEVGIHGLHHDGKLYSSHAEFSRRAARIRAYIREWNVAGFRSPFMHHNLEWLQELGVAYDASTFDTDPFEPQPDGMRTIFPFWVAGPEGTGYVELPYTLVQDFNLFVILQERGIGIWTHKLDWVAEQGGMALLNTHPDYMCFEGRRQRDEYPIAWYEDLLHYIRERYEGAYWSGLPREAAQLCPRPAETAPAAVHLSASRA